MLDGHRRQRSIDQRPAELFLIKHKDMMAQNVGVLSQRFAPQHGGASPDPSVGQRMEFLLDKVPSEL